MGIANKAEYIEQYVAKAEKIISDNNVAEAEKLCTEIISVFEAEVKDIGCRLGDCWRGNADYIQRLKLLRAKLQNYAVNVQSGFIRSHPDSVQNGGNYIDIDNRVNNELTVNISFETTVSNINKLPESVLSQADKESLQGKIVGIELAKKNGESKSKIWDKVKPILEFIISKGADVAIAAMPYIMSALQNR